LAARLQAGTVPSHDRIIPSLLRIVSRLQKEFPKARIKLRADAGFALPMLYEFCEFFGIQYVIGIAANSRLQEKAQRLQRECRQTWARPGRERAGAITGRVNSASLNFEINTCLLPSGAAP